MYYLNVLHPFTFSENIKKIEILLFSIPVIVLSGSFFGQTIGAFVATVASMSANMSKLDIHARIIVHFAIQCTKVMFIDNTFTVRFGVVILSPLRHVAFDGFFQKVRIRIDTQVRDARSACIAYGLSGTLNFTTVVGCWTFDGTRSVSVDKPEIHN